MADSPGKLFRKAVDQNKPLQIVGTINAYCAIQAEHAGHQAIYLSGAGVANASCGLPDLGITTLHDVLEDARRITSASALPLLVDVDTGFGSAFSIARTVREMEKAGVAAIHIEDQIADKRCGHRPGKQLVSKQEMGDRIKAALDSRQDDNFVIMARCDALAGEGIDGVLERCSYYAQIGADIIFAEAMTDLEHYKKIKKQTNIPLLANMTEFGKTGYATASNFAAHEVDMVLYPLSAFRAMSQAAETVYKALLEDGTQQNVLDIMQSRDELYARLDYQSYEDKLDELYGRE